LKVKVGQIIYLSNRNCTVVVVFLPSQGIGVDGIGRIGYATSIDGVVWTTTTPESNTGGGDGMSTGGGSIIGSGSSTDSSTRRNGAIFEPISTVADGGGGGGADGGAYVEHVSQLRKKSKRAIGNEESWLMFFFSVKTILHNYLMFLYRDSLLYFTLLYFSFLFFSFFTIHKHHRRRPIITAIVPIVAVINHHHRQSVGSPYVVDFGGGKLRMYYSSTNNVGRDGTSR
jgi:hypothetical protein